MPYVRWCLYKPEEDVRSPGARVTSSCDSNSGPVIVRVSIAVINNMAKNNLGGGGMGLFSLQVPITVHREVRAGTQAKNPKLRTGAESLEECY